MSWPPEGSRPPVPPRPTPAAPPRPVRASRSASPGETAGETQVKPQAKAAEVKPPQFQNDGIDPRRAALILGLPVAATAVVGLVLIASPTLWWTAAGIATAGLLGGVVLRRSRRARGLLNRLPGVGRASSALKRATNGRFASSPLGRVLRRRPGGAPGGSASRPKGLPGRLRSLLPSWAGGTRKPSSAHHPGGGSGGRPGGRMRSLLNRLKPGGARRPGGSGGSSQGGSRTKPKGLLGRAAGAVGKAAGRASQAVGSKLFRVRPGGKPTSPGGSGKPSGGGKNKPPGGGSGGGSGSSSSLDLGVVWTGLGAGGRLVGRSIGALFGRLRRSEDTDPQDDFDLDGTFEFGIDGTKVNGELRDPDVEDAKAAARQRRKAEKKAAKAAPVWPNVDIDEAAPPPPPPPPANPDAWPDYDVDDYAPKSEQRPPDRSLPAERDNGPPPSFSVSPPPHREVPRITSANTGGTPMSVSPAKYNDLVTTATTRRQGWQDAADAFRRDADSLDEKAKEHDEAARIFKSTGNHAAAQDREESARQLRDDASSCRTFASKMQEKANEEVPAA